MNVCPSCARTGDDIGKCGMTLTCGAPNARKAIPGKDISIQNPETGELRVVSGEAVLRAMRRDASLDRFYDGDGADLIFAGVKPAQDKAVKATPAAKAAGTTNNGEVKGG